MRIKVSLIAAAAFCTLLASLPAGVLPSSAMGVLPKAKKSAPIVLAAPRNSIEKPTMTIPKPKPTSTWPPTGFTSTNGVYARVPTGKELMAILVAKSDPLSPIARCAPDPKKPKNVAMSCGAVLVAATSGCAWWEINSTVTGIDPNKVSRRIPLGSLRVLAGKTKSRVIQTVILVSGVPLTPGVMFTGIVAKCWLTPTSEKIPSTVFTKPSSPTPAPFVTPDSMPTPSESPSETPGETPGETPSQIPGDTPDTSTP
jgi:hypothetical protein